MDTLDILSTGVRTNINIIGQFTVQFSCLNKLVIPSVLCAVLDLNVLYQTMRDTEDSKHGCPFPAQGMGYRRVWVIGRIFNSVHNNSIDTFEYGLLGSMDYRGTMGYKRAFYSSGCYVVSTRTFPEFSFLAKTASRRVRDNGI